MKLKHLKDKDSSAGAHNPRYLENMLSLTCDEVAKRFNDAFQAANLINAGISFIGDAPQRGYCQLQQDPNYQPMRRHVCAAHKVNYPAATCK